MRFIIDGVSDKMNFEDICQIVDSVADLPHSDKTALLRDLAHLAAKPLNVDGNIVFNALLKREELVSTGVGNDRNGSLRSRRHPPSRASPTSRPSALAVLRFIAISYLVGA
jgi:hypothetical protein